MLKSITTAQPESLPVLQFRFEKHYNVTAKSLTTSQPESLPAPPFLGSQFWVLYCGTVDFFSATPPNTIAITIAVVDTEQITAPFASINRER